MLVACVDRDMRWHGVAAVEKRLIKPVVVIVVGNVMSVQNQFAPNSHPNLRVKCDKHPADYCVIF